jgi:histidinol dehydrogenase
VTPPLLARTDLRGTTLDAMALRSIVPRADVDVAAAIATVAPICEDVRTRGVPASSSSPNASTASPSPTSGSRPRP